MDNRIVVKFNGGLGNQLFDYVFYEWIKKEFPDRQVLADLSLFKINMPHNGLGMWEVFPKIELKRASFKDLYDLTGEIPIFYGGPLKNKLNSLRKTINLRFFSQSDLIYKTDDDWTSPDAARAAVLEGKCYFDGYWQDSEYYTQIKDRIVSLFKFEVSGVVPYENSMKMPNAVSLHVRRGDYVDSIFEKEVNEHYYKNAVKYVDEHIQNPHYYIFSDDKEYVKREFEWLSNKTIVDGFDDEKAYIDMYLMSLTPNSIITNSTFSLWAAYLNRNNNVNIIYPDVQYLAHKKISRWIGIKANG